MEADFIIGTLRARITARTASSALGDVVKPGNRHHVGPADEHPEAVAANSDAGRVVYVDLARHLAVPKVVQVRVGYLQKQRIPAHEFPNTNVRGLEVDHDILSDEAGQERRGVVGSHDSGHLAGRERVQAMTLLRVDEFYESGYCPATMSPKNPSLQNGLAALGLCGMALWSVAVLAQSPAPGSVPPAPADSAPTQTSSVLLLTNGRVVQGVLSENDSNYILRQRGGNIQFPKREVEKIFGSMQAIYQYKLSRLAHQDPDEHMKLAKWCLTMKMVDEARSELEMVLKLSPGSSEAKAMVVSLDAEADRMARAQFDPGVTQVAATVTTPDRGRPAELSPAHIRSRSGALGLPVIFDLPPTVAVRRAQEFARYVHPELQRHCAKCHNERSAIPFQLIQARTKRDYSDEMIVRTNMEATLRLVDPDNLPKSALLTNSLLPHKPNNQPILPSPKVLAYRTFSTWVNSLQATPAASGPAQAIPGTTPSGSFASDRAVAPGSTAQSYTPASMAPGTLPAMTSRAATPMPPSQLAPDVYAGAQPYVPDNADFPVPFAVGGLNSVPHPQSPPGTAPGAPGTSGAQAGTAAASNPAPDATRTVPYAHGTFQPAPGAPPIPVSIPKPGDPAEKDKSKDGKPSKLDPRLLEKFFTNRKGQ
jgi:hypothetical protein